MKILYEVKNVFPWGDVLVPVFKESSEYKKSNSLRNKKVVNNSTPSIASKGEEIENTKPHKMGFSSSESGTDFNLSEYIEVKNFSEELREILVMTDTAEMPVIPVSKIKHAVKLLNDGCVLGHRFNEWRKSMPRHYLELTTETEQFIYFIKTEVINKIFGDKLI